MRSRLIVGGLLVVALIAGVFLAIRLSNSPAEEPAAADLDAIQAEMDAGSYASARGQLEEIIATDEDNAEAHFKLGLVYFNIGEYQLAEERFRQAMELEPERAAAVQHNLGVLAYQVGDMEAALRAFEAALDADPEDADTHYQLGATYLVQAFPMNALEPDPELLQKAEEEFQQALEIVPRKPEALVGLANVYMLRDRMEEAVDLLEQAVEQAPEMREALFALGRAYAAVGEMDEAQTTLQAFLDTNPPPVWAQQAEEMLGDLGSE